VSRRGAVLFIAMCVIWGIPYLLIKVAVEDFSPAALALGRTAIGAVLLLPVAFARRQVWPVFTRWQPLLLYTVVEICVPWLLLGYAEQRLSSSLTGLLIAAVPLIAAVLARVTGIGHEVLGSRRVIGLLMGFAGVGALVGFEVGADDLWSILAVATVAVCYAVGPMILARSLSGLPGLGVVAASVGLAGLAYLPAGVASAPAAMPSAAAIASVVVLGVVCTAAAFLIFFELIAEVGPARAVVITYVNPAVAVMLGVLVLDEAFTVATLAGFVLIIAGSVLATGTSAPRAHHRKAAEVDCADIAAPIGEP
jgi:drug/metabolite transporter (DMT)-like permease